jgi:hypothetical protein
LRSCSRSAGPHNAKLESFAQLINLLDPTAITDKQSYDATDIGHPFVLDFWAAVLPSGPRPLRVLAR